MLQRSLGFPLFSACLVLSLASCASAPPASAPASSKASKAAEPSSINLLCHEGARAVRFDKMSVPDGERPIDVALTRVATWVLFDSGRVLQLGRGGGDHLAVQIRLLPVRADIGAIAVDPLDDSVWMVSNSSVSLYRISPDGQMSTIKLQRKVEGAGGFSGLTVARDAIYAQPTCADSAVWRLDRSGRLLGTAFNAPPRTDDDLPVMAPGQPQSACYSVRLERDAEGHVLAWDRKNRTAYQADGQGSWSPTESRLFANFKEFGPDLSVKEVNVGEQSEQWYFPGVGGNLFFWKGQPVFVGNFTAKERARGNDTVLYIPGAAAAREVIMTCNGFAVRRVAADSTGYVALTDRFLILGDLANAPDLP